jgi:hypothetical protein
LRQGIRSRKSLPVRQRIGSALTCRRVATDRNPDRVHHLRRGQSREAARAHDCRHAGDGRMIDTIAEIIKHICDLAEHLVGEHGRDDQVAAAACIQLGRGQQCGNRVAWMSSAMGETDESVVKVQISDHHAVGENGEIGCRSDAAA